MMSEPFFDTCLNYAFFNLLRHEVEKGEDNFKELHVRSQATQKTLCAIPDYKLSGSVKKNPSCCRTWKGVRHTGAFAHKGIFGTNYTVRLSSSI